MNKEQANVYWCDYCRLAPVEHECEVCGGRMTNAWKYAQQFVFKRNMRGQE